jgi:hypothetical protein
MKRYNNNDVNNKGFPSNITKMVLNIFYAMRIVILMFIKLNSSSYFISFEFKHAGIGEAKNRGNIRYSLEIQPV